MKKETWVVVANSAEARIFRVENNHLDSEITTLLHPESRLHEGDLTSGRPGRTADRMGPGRHALEPTTSAKQHQFSLFAKDLAERLDLARAEGRLEKFYLLASPSFLGLLRQAIGQETWKLLGAEVAKDVVKMKPDTIRTYLPPVL